MNCIAIDDEPIALGIIKKYCERMGDMSLETFTNPHLGLRRIIEEKPDIVFLDIEMNGMSGMELARHARQRLSHLHHRLRRLCAGEL